MTLTDLYTFCDTRYPSVTQARIDEVQAKFGVSLPRDYQDFLLAYNGGYFIGTVEFPVQDFPIDGCNQTISVNELSGIDAPVSCNDLAATSNLMEMPDDEIEYLVIGSDPGGFLICLVVIDDPDYFGIVALKTFQDWFTIANSFTEFLDLLRPYSIQKEIDPSIAATMIEMRRIRSDNL